MCIVRFNETSTSFLLIFLIMSCTFQHGVSCNIFFYAVCMMLNGIFSNTCTIIEHIKYLNVCSSVYSIAMDWRSTNVCYVISILQKMSILFKFWYAFALICLHWKQCILVPNTKICIQHILKHFECSQNGSHPIPPTSRDGNGSVNDRIKNYFIASACVSIRHFVTL